MLLYTNTISFYVTNFVALLTMVILVWRIRHTDDDTYLRQECVWLVSIWVIFSILQYIVTIFNYQTQCKADNGLINTDDLYHIKQVSYKILYWLIMFRDAFCLFIIVLYQYRASSSQLYFSRLLDLDDKDSTKMAL